MLFQCLRMGFPFLKRNWQDKRIRFLVFEDSCEKTFTSSWSMFQEEMTNMSKVEGACSMPSLPDGAATAAIADASAVQGAAPARPRQVADAAVEPPGQVPAQEEDSEEEEDEDEDEDPERLKVPKVLSTPHTPTPPKKRPAGKAKGAPKNKAAKLEKPDTRNPSVIAKTAHAAYCQTKNGSESLVSEIGQCMRTGTGTWAFSRKFGPGFTERLQKATDKMVRIRSPFHVEYMTKEFKQLKDEYDDTHLQVLLKSFIDLQPYIDAVVLEKQRLLDQLQLEQKYNTGQE